MENNNGEVYTILEETRDVLFNLTGNFWVDALILLIFPWLIVTIEGYKRFKWHLVKVVLFGLTALVISSVSLGSVFGGSKEAENYKDKYFETFEKYEVLESKFEKYADKVDEYKTKVAKLEAEQEKEAVLVKETEKATPKPTQKPTKKPVEKKKVVTMEDQARAKLKGRVDLPYMEAMNILINIDVLVDPINEVKFPDDYYGDIWIQTFKFSDGSKIRVSKYQDNGEFIFMAILAN